MEVNEAILMESLLHRIDISSEAQTELSPNADRYVKLTDLMILLTNKRNEIKLSEEEYGEAFNALQGRLEKVTVPLKSLDREEKAVFIDMLDNIASDIYLYNDRLGWLLTQLLAEYYSKASGIDIEHWLYEVDGAKKLKLILLLMSQSNEFKDEFPGLKFIINQYSQENEGI